MNESIVGPKLIAERFASNHFALVFQVRLKYPDLILAQAHSDAGPINLAGSSVDFDGTETATRN